MPREYAPPPLLTIVDGITYVNLQQLNTNDAASQSSSSSSSSSSIIIVIIVISCAIIVSASLYLLLRFISRRCRRRFSSATAVDDVVSDRRFHGGRVSPDDLISSLPLFTFSSVAGNITGGDCAVCLSNFESHDQLRLLPLCCHAFHARCIDTWLLSNQTCPLCRSTVYPTESDVLDKIHSAADERVNSFRIEIGNISRRREASDSGDIRRSYSIGSFEYIVDDNGYEVSVQSNHRRGISDCTSTDKESTGVTVDAPPTSDHSLASEVAAGSRRSWLRDYVDRLSSNSLSSRTLSFRSSGRFIAGSSRRSEGVVTADDDLEANRIGEEITELFRWLSGV